MPPHTPPDSPATLPPDLPPPAPARPPVKAVRKPGRLARFVWYAVALVTLVGLGTLAVNRWWPKRNVDDVLTAVAAVGDFDILVTDKGELESSESLQVLCEVEGGGKLTTILAEGTPVKKGDVVARFDTDVLQKGINEQEVKWEQAEGKEKAAVSELEVQRNKAESEVAKAELARTLADIDLEAYEGGKYKAELDKLNNALATARKDLREAEDNLVFTRGMVKKGFSQLDQLRQMELTQEGKKFAVQEKEADLDVFTRFTRKRTIAELEAKAKEAGRDLERTKKSQQAATEKAVNEATAARKTADLEKRQLERLKEQLHKCEVKAPGDGIVIYFKRPWDESARIRPGATVFFQQPIFNLPNLSRMNVKMKVHESAVKKVRAGLKCTLKLDALPGHILHGQVVSVATLAQGDDWRSGGVKEYETMISIADMPTDAGLRPGMSADVKILAKTVPAALTVPVQAVTEVGGKHVCYVVAGGRVERREVEIGDGNDQLVQVLGGLSAGDRVALDARSRAAEELGTGAESKPEPEKDKAAKAK